MDGIDRELLNIIQTDFPVLEKPYLELGNRVGISEQDAFHRIDRLREIGIIRRLGGVFDSRRLGYRSTLCAAKVSPDKIDFLAEKLMEMPGVTHNYLRNHAYNMWFTLIAPTHNAVEDTLISLREVSGTKDIYSLPALNVFKIKVDLDLNGSRTLTGINSEALDSESDLEAEQGAELGTNTRSEPCLQSYYRVNDEEITLIRVLQEDLPRSIRPYETIAETLSWSSDKVLQMTQHFVACKVIRRFGAVLRHQKAGFVANVMGVWRVNPERVVSVGRKMAQFKEVSHCYERPTLPDWPYNLFTMVHGRSEEDCQRIINQISQTVGVHDYDMLYSLQELKKSSMKYFLD